MSSWTGKALRSTETVVCHHEADVTIENHKALCTVLVASHDEGGALLVLRQDATDLVTAAIPLHREVTTNTAQTKNGFKCTIRGGASTSPSTIDIETSDIAILQDILQEVKHCIAQADDLYLDVLGRSFQWLSFYRISEDHIGVPLRPASTDEIVGSDGSSLESITDDEVTSSIFENPFVSPSTDGQFDHVIAHHDERRKAKDQYINSVLERRREEYTQVQELLVKCTTWNMAGKELVESLNTLLSHSDDVSAGPVQLYSMAFQEMDLSAEAYLTTSDIKQSHYLHRIESSLGEYYELVASHQLVGILLCVYAHKSIAPTITGIEKSYVACGLLGMVGNKGAVGIRLKVMNTTFAFIGCHLAAGQTNQDKRSADLREIERRLFNEQGIWDSGLVGVDNIFLAGDMNYRLSLSRDQVDKALNAKEVISMLQYDQLVQHKKDRKIHSDWMESDINFPPTYKFDIGTDIYDTSDKRRIPSWTDRILTRSTWPVKLLSGTYTSIPEYFQSDHKPVVATFQARVEAILTDRENAVRSDALKELDRYENEATPLVRVKLGEDQIEMGDVFYAQPKVRSFGIHNSGNVASRFSFVPHVNASTICKRWLWPQPVSGTLAPGDDLEIQVTICVDEIDAGELNLGRDQLYDVLVLHVEHGTDSYISVHGDWQTTCVGQSLDVLSTSRSIRSHRPGTDISRDKIDGTSIPKVISRICDHLLTQNPSDRVKLFTATAEKMVLDSVQESLDTDRAFDDHHSSTSTTHALCELLPLILKSLSEPVIPESLYDQAISGTQPLTVLDALPNLNLNLVIYLQGFINNLVMTQTWDTKLEDRLCAVLSEVLLRSKTSKSGNAVLPMLRDGNMDRRKGFMKRLAVAMARSERK